MLIEEDEISVIMGMSELSCSFLSTALEALYTHTQIPAVYANPENGSDQNEKGKG